ncbi:MAG: hypothetical protein JOY71_14510, partial [Acetobacteraceae bacterium]|nr:hypothetical protein [Acetobacteraceae bacterium]
MPSFLSLIYAQPLPLVGLAFLVIGLGFSLIVLALSYRVLDRPTRARDSELISFAVNNVAILYSVLLAFIAVAAWANFLQSSDVANTEATLCGSLYRDTLALPTGRGAELRIAIKAYLTTVIL